MRRCIEDETFAPEGGTEATEHEVPFQQEHLHAALRQQISAEQAADPRSDYDSVVTAGILAPGS